MSGKLKIDVEANVSSAKKALKGLQNDIKQTQSAADKMQKKTTFTGGRGGKFVGGNGGTGGRGGLMQSLSDFGTNKLKGLDKWGIADKVGNLSQMGGFLGRAGGFLGRAAAVAGPYAAAVAAPIAAVAAFGKMGSNRAAQGQTRFNQERTLNQSLGQLSKNMGGTGFVGGFTQELIQMGIKGKTPFEELTKTAQKMMLAFRGNQQEAQKWTKIIADLAAGTGESATFFAELIAKAQQFGTVENESIKQLSEKGIPIYKTLANQLGITVEDARKLAQQGKITAEQFKQAAEAAVKISVAGANQNNVIKDAAYYEKQRQELQNAVYADTYTKEFERMRAEHAQRRLDKDADYYANQDVQTMHEDLARVTAGICEIMELFKDGLQDLTNATGEVVASFMGWLAHTVNDKQNIDAQNSINKLNSYVVGNNASASANGVTMQDLFYNMEDADSVAGLSARIAEMDAAIKKTENNIADGYVTEERRKEGQALVETAKEHLRIMQDVLATKQRDIDAEKERQRLAKISLDLQTRELTSNARNEQDFITAWNNNNKSQRLSGVDAVTERYNAALENIRNGSGTEADEQFISHFRPMVQMNERRTKGRADFELNQRAAIGDANAKFQLEFNKTIETMEGLGYTIAEIEKVTTERQKSLLSQRASALRCLEPQQQNLESELKHYEGLLNHVFCARNWGEHTLTSYERGAWGQGLKMENYDPQAQAAAQQFRQMEEQNRRLQCQINLHKNEIAAIQKLNLVPRAL
jgi:tape measure domain-containing protein